MTLFTLALKFNCASYEVRYTAMDSKFEVLTGRDQILKRPQMWIGAMSPVQQNMFVISNEHVEQKSIEFIPAFRKLADEILDNALDVLIEHCNASGEIKVKMSDDSIYVEDNGPGIPVVKHKLTEAELKSLPEEEAKKLADSYIPFIAWTRLFSGSNFQDSDDKKTIGNHGIGSKAAAIFSTKFIGKTDDGKHSCTVKSVSNLESSTCKVDRSSGCTGTSVEFFPDFARFNLSKVEQVYKDLMYQRLLCLAITFPKIKFVFNGKQIRINDKKFLNMFSEHIEFTTFDKGFIGVFPNEHDDFSFFTFVNGMHMSRGGSHVDYTIMQIVNPIRDKLVKKYKNIKPADIKNKLTLVLFLRDFTNPKFDSQTKETLTNSSAEVSTYYNGAVDFEKLSKQVLKNEAIISPIVDIFKLKEELKARQELKQAKKVKVKSDKYFPGIGEKKYLFLVEGLSAGGGLMKCLGRNGKYFYCLRGLALNAYDSSIQKIAANQEIKEVMNILNLDLTKKNEEEQQIEFEKIVIATDADIDGTNIASMLLGWWYRLCPDLYKQHKIYRLNTPIVIVEDAKENIKEWFFNLNDFKKWEATNTDKKLKIIYLKGLGSLSTNQLDFIIQKQGFDSLLDEYTLDDQSDEYFKNWLGSDAEPRKKYMKDYDFDINAV